MIMWRRTIAGCAEPVCGWRSTRKPARCMRTASSTVCRPGRTGKRSCTMSGSRLTCCASSAALSRRLRAQVGRPAPRGDRLDDFGRYRQRGAAGQDAPARAAGEPAIIIGSLDQPPALASLAADKGFARRALRLQRVERLLQPFLGGFAGVDGAAPYRRPRRHGLRPKKRGPDQRAPPDRLHSDRR